MPGAVEERLGRILAVLLGERFRRIVVALGNLQARRYARQTRDRDRAARSHFGRDRGRHSGFAMLSRVPAPPRPRRSARAALQERVEVAALFQRIEDFTLRRDLPDYQSQVLARRAAKPGRWGLLLTGALRRQR